MFILILIIKPIFMTFMAQKFIKKSSSFYVFLLTLIFMNSNIITTVTNFIIIIFSNSHKRRLPSRFLKKSNLFIQLLPSVFLKKIQVNLALQSGNLSPHFLPQLSMHEKQKILEHPSILPSSFFEINSMQTEHFSFSLLFYNKLF